jgi:CheY-like chemotaxis protein
MKPDILVIDNHRKSITYIATLAGFGYRIAEAHSTDEALDQLQTGAHPSTVIVDLKLTDLSQVLPVLRAETKAQMIVIGTDADEAYAAGADVFLPKPVDLDAVLDAVRN